MNGDIRLRVEGLMLERLMQRALSEGAAFRSIRRDGPRAMIFECDSASADILLALCERFSLPCRILSRRGKNAMLLRLKRRATLLAGMLVFVAMLSLFFGRIWIVDIELTGNAAGRTRSLESALIQMNIRRGMLRSEIDPDALAGALSAAAPDFTFVGVKIQGVRLLIEAAPAVPQPEIYQLDGSCDLIAACDGVVESITVLSGQACVKPGDTVFRGQVLIRGNERVSKEENRAIAALGTVVARTWHEGRASLPLTRTENNRTGRMRTRADLRMMQFSRPLVEAEPYPSQDEETQRLPIGGLFLPLEIARTTYYETRPRQTQVDIGELQRQLSILAYAQAGADLIQFPDGEIAAKWIEYTQGGGMLHARAVYETHINIAVSGDALYQQGG